MLIQSTCLTIIIEWTCVFRDCMSELMPDNVDTSDKVVEELATISEDHLKLFWVPN
jgi:hypothetical protein